MATPTTSGERATTANEREERVTNYRCRMCEVQFSTRSRVEISECPVCGADGMLVLLVSPGPFSVWLVVEDGVHVLAHGNYDDRADAESKALEYTSRGSGVSGWLRVYVEDANGRTVWVRVLRVAVV